VDDDRSFPPADQPDQAGACQEVFLQSGLHLPERVPLAEHFHGQIRGQVRYRLHRNLPTRELFAPDERNIRQKHQAGLQPKWAAWASQDPKVAGIDEIAQEG
jgi:hypothetical protein